MNVARRHGRLAMMLAAAGLALGGAPLATAEEGEPGRDAGDALVAALETTSRGTSWSQVAAIPLRFPTYHPQGMLRIGDRIYMSSVEIIEPTQRFPEPVDGYDRTPGRGVGHLFELDLEGNLLRSITLGEGTIYHPGGIDYDGERLWVPVAEYRPDSRAIVYEVDPETLEAREAFRVDDHIGGIVADRAAGGLVGVSWGSRRLYQLSELGGIRRVSSNESHYVDFQDCQYAFRSRMVCTGVASLPVPEAGDEEYRLGGYAVVDMRRLTVAHETPLSLWDPTGIPLTQNPTHLEALEDGRLRLYSAPADDNTTLYAHETAG